MPCRIDRFDAGEGTDGAAEDRQRALRPQGQISGSTIWPVHFRPQLDLLVTLARVELQLTERPVGRRRYSALLRAGLAAHFPHRWRTSTQEEAMGPLRVAGMNVRRVGQFARLCRTIRQRFDCAWLTLGDRRPTRDLRFDATSSSAYRHRELTIPPARFVPGSSGLLTEWLLTIRRLARHRIERLDGRPEVADDAPGDRPSPHPRGARDGALR